MKSVAALPGRDFSPSRCFRQKTVGSPFPRPCERWKCGRAMRCLERGRRRDAGGKEEIPCRRFFFTEECGRCFFSP